MSIRILEFGAHGLSHSAQHFQKFSEEKNLAWEIEHYPAFDESLLENAQGALVDFALSENMIGSLSTLPTLVRAVDCFDSMIRDGKWYPRVLWFEALRNLVVESARNIDNRGCGFVIGTNECARVAAAVMADLGFPTIYLISEDDTIPEKILKDLRRKFIGVEFQVLEASEMTLQSVQGSVLFNCVDLKKFQTLQEDLSYFNFMKRDGAVFDLFLCKESLLLEEARKAELRAIEGAQFFLKRNLMFLEAIGLGSQVNAEEFQQSWLAFVKTMA